MCLTCCVGWGTKPNEKPWTFCDTVKSVGGNNPVVGSMCSEEQQVPTACQGRGDCFVLTCDNGSVPACSLTSKQEESLFLFHFSLFPYIIKSNFIFSLGEAL